MRVRDIKRALSKLGYTEGEINSLGLLKEDLMSEYEAALHDKADAWLNSEVDEKGRRELAWRSAMLCLLLAVGYYYSGSLRDHFNKRLKHVRVSSSSVVALAAVLVMCCLDFLGFWCRATVLAGWVCPSRYRYLLQLYGMPMLPLYVSPSVLMGGKGGGGGEVYIRRWFA